jgi:hypothetical protein
VNSSVNQLEAARAAGGDASVFLTNQRLEIGTSYQRILQGHEINSVGTYISWQPPHTSLDMKAEYDRSYNGRGFWLETAYSLNQAPIRPALLKRVQFVGRVQQFHPLHGGGTGLPRVDAERLAGGLNYFIRDDLKLVSSYERRFNSPENVNVWNVGFTYRFVVPLWPGRGK